MTVSVAATAQEIRVGVLAFQDKPREIAAIDRLFARAAARIGPDTRFQLAVGTQKDIASWIEHGKIDVALVSPLIFGQLLSQAMGAESRPWVYLASENETASTAGLIPPGILVASPNLAAATRIADALKTESDGRFVGAPDWESAVTQSKENFLSAGFLRHLQARDTVTVSETEQMLLLHRCTQSIKPRIAVVFAGGGAKCAYQVGAIQAVEESLSDMRSKFHDASFDIGLVVGTSGGALNALPVALGITKFDETKPILADLWRTLDQRDLIRPSGIVRLLMVLWFVCVQTVVLIRIRRARHFRNPEKHPWIISRYFILIGLAQIAIARLPYKPWSLLGTNSGLHHLWLWLSWGLEGSGYTLIAVAIVGFIARKFSAVKNAPFPVRLRVVRSIAWFGVIVIPIMQTINILWCQPTLSDSRGIEASVLENYSAVIDRRARIESPAGIDFGPATDARERFERMGREIVDRNLLSRDLVLTGSVLPEETAESAGDLYFYARGRSASGEPRFGARGVSLDRRPELFMDVLMGSGAIYPVFPARTLRDFPTVGRTVELVDGSFSHRSPVEAAVQWGATHVLLVQAATDEVSPRGAFIDNVMAAVNHLYDEAQLLDVRSRAQAVTLTLTPRPPHIGLLDFSDNLIDIAIAKGYREAKGVIESSTVPEATYRKELSEPIFWTAPMRGGSSGCADLKL